MFAIESLIESLGNPSDLEIQNLYQPDGIQLAGGLLYLTTITNRIEMERLLFTPLQSMVNEKQLHPKDLVNHPLFKQCSSMGQWIPANDKSIASKLFSGHCILLLEGNKEALAFDVAEWQYRSITPPETESSLVGPRDAFVENLNVNIALIRARIRHANLIVRSFNVGQASTSNVTMFYMNGIADPQIVDNITNQINSIQIDSLLDTTQLSHLIVAQKKWWSPFPLMQSTERPDKTVSALLEGRVALLMNTSPTAIILPATLTALYQTADDYYFPFLSGTFLRFIRLIGLFMTLFLPALYISITTVNQDILRIQFMLAIAASREGVPYPAYIEVCIMVFLLELINEASVRLPRVIGGTATIVGGLIIGTAAAQAHLISNIMIVITAATAIGSFTTPNYMVGVALRMCSYLLIALSIPLGLYGMTIGTALIFMALCHLKSFGVSYLAPFDTFLYKDLFRDAMTRAPIGMSVSRPKTYRSSPAKSRRISRKEGEKLL